MQPPKLIALRSLNTKELGPPSVLVDTLRYVSQDKSIPETLGPVSYTSLKTCDYSPEVSVFVEVYGGRVSREHV